MAFERILIACANSEIGTQLENSVLRPEGYSVTYVADSHTAIRLADQSEVDLFIIGDKTTDLDGLDLAAELSISNPTIPILLLGHITGLEVSLGKYGIWDVIPIPAEPGFVLETVQRTLNRAVAIREEHIRESKRLVQGMHRRMEATETLQMVGRSVAGILELDEILSTVVDAAVEMTGAEEGSLLLLDESTGELYMRAARNFQDEFVHRFRLPIRDSLAGKVMRTGKPLAINAAEPHKIKTAYLVHTLIYVPLTVHNRVIGVLGVDNRNSGHPFQDEHLSLIISLADYAAIAIENARMYTAADLERRKWETILTKVEDGVIIFDAEHRILLVNQSVRRIFGITESGEVGKPVELLFENPDLLAIFKTDHTILHRTEVKLEDGRVFNAQVSPIVDLGTVITLQDITHLKELDRIKSDFVHTVSHDLRSPLTAIMGYIELIGRAGPVTDQQKEFIHRIQISVRTITSLINDLLELGRIESGFDTKKEIVPLAAVIQLAMEGLEVQTQARQLKLQRDIQPENVTILGNTNQLNQMITNLLENAIKFSPPGGVVLIRTGIEAGQIVIRIRDSGQGIPPADQPYIFDKFYRASNVPTGTPGSGLGLAIVQTIIENHSGRIWVDSIPGQGSTFTVVLPLAEHIM